MKIDDRKVNGRITIEPEDTVDGLKIFINKLLGTAMWTAGVDENQSLIMISPDVVAPYIQNALRMNLPIRFIIASIDTDNGDVVLNSPYSYTKNLKTILIDLDAIITGKKLQITVSTGEIALVDNT